MQRSFYAGDTSGVFWAAIVLAWAIQVGGERFSKKVHKRNQIYKYNLLINWSVHAKVTKNTARETETRVRE